MTTTSRNKATANTAEPLDRPRDVQQLRFSSQNLPTNPNEAGLLDIDQLASILDQHPRSIQRKMRAGEIPYIRAGKKPFFRLSEVLEALTVPAIERRKRA